MKAFSDLENNWEVTKFGTSRRRSQYYFRGNDNSRHWTIESGIFFNCIMCN